jgi:glycine cleavage system H lipoate-binding protein
MEASNIDIFDTNGIEYLLIIGYLFCLIFFWKFLYRPTAPARGRLGRAEIHVSPNIQFRLADDYLYHPGHSWAAQEEPDIFKVGIDDFAQKLLGRLDVVELPKVGSRLEQGENGWKLHIGSKAIAIFSPLDGEVIAVNENAIKNPLLINQDPYGYGWLVKVRVTKTNENLRNLLSGELAAAWFKDTTTTLQHDMDVDFANTFQSRKAAQLGIAKALSPDNWDSVAAKFFASR